MMAVFLHLLHILLVDLGEGREERGGKGGGHEEKKGG